MSQSLVNEGRFPLFILSEVLQETEDEVSQSLVNEGRFPQKLQQGGGVMIEMSQSLVNEGRFPHELVREYFIHSRVRVAIPR